MPGTIGRRAGAVDWHPEPLEAQPGALDAEPGPLEAQPEPLDEEPGALSGLLSMICLNGRPTLTDRLQLGNERAAYIWTNGLLWVAYQLLMAANDPSHDDIKQDVLTNPRYAAFFAPYHPKVQESFADRFARYKVEWQWKGAQAEAEQTHASSRFSAAAYARLWDIQHKKLFDLQCRWRAGQLTVPGVDCSPDFGVYDADIENCPLLEPITPEELEMYCDFVRQTPDFDDVPDRYGETPWGQPRDWQDYEKMRLYDTEFNNNTPDHECEGIHPSAWYDFHNMRTGNGVLLGLPDVRGAQEKRYREAYWAKRRSGYTPPPPPDDPRPTYLSLREDKALMAAFMQQFETARLRRQQAAHNLEQARAAADEQVEEDFDYLKALSPEDSVPVEATADWRTALRRAVQESQRSQLLAHLPQVFDEYQMRQGLGITHPKVPGPNYRMKEQSLGRREELLDGREALGEPRTFDFYD